MAIFAKPIDQMTILELRYGQDVQRLPQGSCRG